MFIENHAPARHEDIQGAFVRGGACNDNRYSAYRTLGYAELGRVGGFFRFYGKSRYFRMDGETAGRYMEPSYLYAKRNDVILDRSYKVFLERGVYVAFLEAIPERSGSVLFSIFFCLSSRRKR